MSEKERNYPTAVVAGPERGDEGLRDGLRWVLAKASEEGSRPLIYAPGKSNIRDVPLLEAAAKDPRFVVGTWRTVGDWGGGPVLATWPDRRHLGEIADDPRTTALCVVPWAEGEIDGWMAAVAPERLDGAPVPSLAPLDPVVIEGLETLSSTVNHANHLAGSMDRRFAVAVLHTLKQAHYSLPPEEIYSWAMAHGWPSRGADRLRDLASDFEAGKRPRMRGDFPFRPDILQVWRDKAGKS